MGDEPLTAEKVEGMLAKMLKKYRDNADDGDDLRGGRVPYERFQAKDRALKEALEEVEALRVQVQGLGKQYGTDLETAKTGHAQEIGKFAARHNEDMTLRDLGLDNDGRSALRDSWSRMPEATRGKSAGEWWSTQVESVKQHYADPKTKTLPELPKTLTAYLPEPPKSSTTQTAAGATQQAASGLGIRVGTLSPNKAGIQQAHADPATAIRSAATFADLEKALLSNG